MNHQATAEAAAAAVAADLESNDSNILGTSSPASSVEHNRRRTSSSLMGYISPVVVIDSNDDNAPTSSEQGDDDSAAALGTAAHLPILMMGTSLDNVVGDVESDMNRQDASASITTQSQQRRAQMELMMDFGRERRSRFSFVNPDGGESISLINFHLHHHHHDNKKKDENDIDNVDNETSSIATSAAVAAATEDYGSIAASSSVIQEQEENNWDVSSSHPHHQHEDYYSYYHDRDESSSSRRLLVGGVTTTTPAEKQKKKKKKACIITKDDVQDYIEQIPAIIVTMLLCLMIAVPFGVSYFPIGWTSDPSANKGEDAQDDTTTSDINNVYGPFPLPGKEALGIRMALFATMVGQVVLTMASNFDNPVSFQLLENVPFYHALARIVTDEMGFGIDALATLFFLLGLSSVMVGTVFYTLGRLRLGRVTYYFPGHVLVGCIAGIGVFIMLTSIEVANNQHFTLTRQGIQGFVDNLHLYGLVIVLEVVLRCLSYALTDKKTGQPRFRFLVPIFFCSIVPLFYIGLLVLGVSREQAKEMGYLFPDPADALISVGNGGDQLSFHDRVFDGHVLDMFRIVASIPHYINWTAVWKSMGTLLALCSFSLIHVPLNLPAFAVSSDVDVDMDVELMAHGYSNVLSGLFGGLQNVMTYSCSVLFMKSGGRGKASCFSIAFLTGVLFVYGPTIAIFVPRCMAGTLLLHLGLDLFLEGVYDSYRNFDRLEYAGIWFIIVMMTTFGMTAGLLAGILSALSTHAIQSITHLDPIFRIRSASTLKSSGSWCRSDRAVAFLDDPHTGRARIMVVQLQGHLFFGNVAEMTDHLKRVLNAKRDDKNEEEPIIVILDFSLVVGMDSAGAHAVAKLKNIMHRLFHVEVTIFVTGSHRNGFPCDYALSEALMMARKASDKNDNHNNSDYCTGTTHGDMTAAMANGGHRWRPCQHGGRGGSDSQHSVMTVLTPESVLCLTTTDRSDPEKAVKMHDFPRNRVCRCLDEALIFAEDVLIAREDPFLLESTAPTRPKYHRQSVFSPTFDPVQEDSVELDQSEPDELIEATRLAKTAIPDGGNAETEKEIVALLSVMRREVYRKDDVLWKQGCESDSAKLLIAGRLTGEVEGTEICEVVIRGNFLGELGLVDGTRRLNTVRCASQVAILYSLARPAWEELNRTNPKAARLLDRVAIRNLAHRIQHVSNRIFETRCMPI